ncbi:MAG: hypothetical protein WCO20_06240, partial [Holophagaceae bacterium]
SHPLPVFLCALCVLCGETSFPEIPEDPEKIKKSLRGLLGIACSDTRGEQKFPAFSVSAMPIRETN